MLPSKVQTETKDIYKLKLTIKKM